MPVVETQAENLSAYIPTNLISITDGQIYLSPRLVRKNQFPAVDIGLSVSRVGGKAQHRAFREVAGNLRVTLSQFEELEDFARFGTRLDDNTRARLTRGAAVRTALRQPERDPMPAVEQLLVLIAALEGLLDGLSENEVAETMIRMRNSVGDSLKDVDESIRQNRSLEEAEKQSLLRVARTALALSGPGGRTPLAAFAALFIP